MDNAETTLSGSAFQISAAAAAGKARLPAADSLMNERRRTISQCRHTESDAADDNSSHCGKQTAQCDAIHHMLVDSSFLLRE